jgi:hypothetical protein
MEYPEHFDLRCVAHAVNTIEGFVINEDEFQAQLDAAKYLFMTGAYLHLQGGLQAMVIRTAEAEGWVEA